MPEREILILAQKCRVRVRKIAEKAMVFEVSVRKAREYPRSKQPSFKLLHMLQIAQAYRMKSSLINDLSHIQIGHELQIA